MSGMTMSGGWGTWGKTGSIKYIKSTITKCPKTSVHDCSHPLHYILIVPD